METKNVGLYVHIPFCMQKCKYCDFKSYAGKENLIKEYVECLKYEIEKVGKEVKQDYQNGLDDLGTIDTIYIGGGTPSYISENYIYEIMCKIQENFVLKDNIEITIEANPGTVNEAKLKRYVDSKINRISLGLQSTQERLLKQLGRIHTYEEFEESYDLARKVGFNNINVDLMIGLPTQTLEDVTKALEKVIKLNPEHISVYSLIVEENTPLYEDVKAKKLILPEDDEERKMYWKVKEILEKCGYVHYEISNFSKKGYESKHNLHCWEQEEYIGFGAAAHSYTNNVRYSNVCEIEKYIQNYKENREEENFIFHEKQNEYMLLGLRKIEGVNIQKFKEKFGEDPIFIYSEKLNRLAKNNLIEIKEDFICLSKKGLDLANIVWQEFV